MVSIGNEKLSVIISPYAGELQSIRSRDGLEYLWQGDRAYWGRRALNMFPLIGRLYGKSYTLHGKTYTIDTHGFLPHAQMETEVTEPAHCRFILRDSEETRASFPYSFIFGINYTLSGSTLEIDYTVDNLSDEVMYCAMGGHPGFNVPLEAGLSFTDYEMRFPDCCHPDLIGFGPSVLCTGKRTPYPLQEGHSLPLSHELFTEDAIVFANAHRQVELVSEKGHHGVRVAYPQMPYIGFWHMPKTDAPYVCIEPWSALPGREGITEDLEHMPDLTQVGPGEHFVNTWSVTMW